MTPQTASPARAERVPPHVRVVRFFEARPWLGDLLFKVLPLLLLTVMFWGGSTSTSQGGLSGLGFFGVPVNRGLMIILELVVVLPLIFSRIRPGLAATVMAVGASLQIFTLSGPGASTIAVPLVVYSCAKYAQRRSSRLVLLVGLMGALLLGLFTIYAQYRISIDHPDTGVNLPWVASVFVFITLFAASVVLVAWLLGDLSGRRRRETEAVAEQNRLLERERNHEARLAADAERMRIAREMHDVISHSMSVMIAQADGGRYVLGQNPERAGQAFETIGETGREALTEMRRMLGVLRDQQEELAKRPAPGVQDLDQLVADVRASGLPVSLHIAAQEVPALREGVGLAVYRIVQEALTNTLKHGGPEAEAAVWLGTDAAARELLVEIWDSGQGSGAENDGAGSGLRGMSERVQLYGGTLQVHRPERGFAVMARFPLAMVRAGQATDQADEETFREGDVEPSAVGWPGPGGSGAGRAGPGRPGPGRAGGERAGAGGESPAPEQSRGVAGSPAAGAGAPPPGTYRMPRGSNYRQLPPRSTGPVKGSSP